MNNKYEYLVDIAKKTFDLVNGWINPVVKARQMVFDPEPIIKFEYKKEKIQFNIVPASTQLRIIWVNITQIIQFCEYAEMVGNPVPTQYLNAVIIEVIIHELSHLNQVIDTKRYGRDMKYMQFIEVSNDFHIYDFICDAYEVLSTKIAPFMLEAVEDIIGDRAVKNVRYEYRPIGRPQEKLFPTLAGIWNLDLLPAIEWCIKNGYENITIWLLDTDREMQFFGGMYNIIDFISDNKVAYEVFKGVEDIILLSMCRLWTSEIRIDENMKCLVLTSFNIPGSEGVRPLWKFDSLLYVKELRQFYFTKKKNP